MARSSPTRRRRRAALVCGVALTVLVPGCTGTAAPEPIRPQPAAASASPAPPPPPLFYVDPQSPAAQQVLQWAQTRPAEAARLRAISDRPTARWLVGGASSAADRVAAFLADAALAGQTPVLVIHNVPQRDCGRQGSGGAATAEEYRAWIARLAGDIKGRPVTVILEPGAVPDAVDGCVTAVDERFALLRYAVTALKSTGNARVYLDAGHPGWIRDVPKLAAALDRAGIAEADGFALNVANFVDTTTNVRFGHRLSDALGGTVTFVIDTSRNGNGPHPDRTAAGAPSWCNPPGRALGAAPTNDTGLDRVDALLWVKYPGESDGPCRPGEPEIGVWWPEYALGLAERAAG